MQNYKIIFNLTICRYHYFKKLRKMEFLCKAVIIFAVSAVFDYFCVFNLKS